MISIKAEVGEIPTFSDVAEGIAKDTKDIVFRAAQTTASAIEEKVRADIAKAGNFGSRWTEGFKATVSREGNETSIAWSMEAKHWQVFEYGATITGKPWLYFKPTKAPEGSKLFSMTKGGALPEVIRKHQVTIPKKFHITEIVEEEINKIGDMLDGAES